MLFVYNQPQRVSFWMKDTKKDLSIAFIGSNNRIIQIANLKAQSLKIDTKNISEINFDSFVTIAKIKNNKNKAYDSFKGGYGLFYETKGENNFQFIKKFTKKIQTITYFGLNNKEIEKNVLKYLPLGIDRIVPIGKANEMSFIWDGYNLIETFSRKIDIK
jgi:hypothetical protein